MFIVTTHPSLPKLLEERNKNMSLLKELEKALCARSYKHAAPNGDQAPRISSNTSENSYTPLRPTIQPAATSAPAAKPSRERAVWVNVI